SSSSEPGSLSSSIREFHIANEILGTRRGFRRAFGQKLSGTDSSNSFASLDVPVPPIPEDVQHYMVDNYRYVTHAQPRRRHLKRLLLVSNTTWQCRRHKLHIYRVFLQL
ncbi:hypothetical protein TorRG33x02_262650, partial [Trema orientale]